MTRAPSSTRLAPKPVGHANRSSRPVPGWPVRYTAPSSPIKIPKVVVYLRAGAPPSTSSHRVRLRRNRRGGPCSRAGIGRRCGCFYDEACSSSPRPAASSLGSHGGSRSAIPARRALSEEWSVRSGRFAQSNGFGSPSAPPPAVESLEKSSALGISRSGGLGILSISTTLRPGSCGRDLPALATIFSQALIALPFALGRKDGDGLCVSLVLTVESALAALGHGARD